jgi:pre-mRNA-splicing factor SYF2
VSTPALSLTNPTRDRPREDPLITSVTALHFSDLGSTFFPFDALSIPQHLTNPISPYTTNTTNMPVALKRKGSPSLEEDSDASKRRFAEVEVAPQTDATAIPPTAAPATETPVDATEASAEPPLPTDRAARFAALRARNQASRKENLKDTKNEAKRLSTDPSQLTALSRKKDIAQHKLLKADTEAAGDDFERKRAWDWTIDESERWDKRVAKKERARENVAFQDYSQEAGKIYKRQIGHMEKVGLDERKALYEKQKNEAIDRAVQSGGLEIVETENGELIAVDKDGAFYSTADSTQFVDSKPDRAAVDRLVDDIKKAEENRLKKRRERGKQDDNGEDVSYINEKNKQFNQKLARFYNKYTADIRESFERGTAI